MPFEFPLGKLEIINAALAQTGDNLVSAADDGSEEWKAASPAYEMALGYVCENHPWNWLTEVRTLQPSPTAPANTDYDTAYPLPGDLVHLIMVRIADRPCDWDFLNNQLIVNSQGGPPPPDPATTPAAVTIKGIFSTNSDPTFATPTVVSALQMFVMSGIYRGIRKDLAEAGRLFSAAKAMLNEAKSRHDQQKPKRAMFNFRSTAARRVGRPWSRSPRGWGGSGIPS